MVMHSLRKMGAEPRSVRRFGKHTVEHGESISAIRFRKEDYVDRRIILHGPLDTSGEMITRVSVFTAADSTCLADGGWRSERKR